MSPARSLTVYIVLLAVVDNLAIAVKLLIFVLTDHGVNIGSFGCKFLGFCGNFLMTLGNWILVALSVERFAAVWYPLKLGQNWTFKKSLTVVGGITVPLIGMFLHLFWTTEYVPVETPNTAYCGVHVDYVGFITECWYWINIVIYAIIPYTLLLLFNSLIVAGIIMSRKESRYLNRSNAKDIGHFTSNRQRQITVMLVTSAFVMVILITPRCVFLVLSTSLTASMTTRRGAIVYLLDTLAYVMCDSTHAVNFYLYSFSARRFRKHLWDVLFCRERKRGQSSAQYVTLTSRMSIRFNTALIWDFVERPLVRYQESQEN
ncbi:probable G-protein coupled receptor 139 [Haliotis asinina]|uniref:probable G-protein coupled receptor 139 n=1 Tax=Haliotis asinina TaxID=109174 RepID=UPI0035323D2A